MRKVRNFILFFSCCFTSVIFANEGSFFIESWYADKFKVSLSKAQVRISIGLQAREFANTLDLQKTISGGMYIQNSPNFRIIFNVKRDNNCVGEYDHGGKLCSDYEGMVRERILKEGWQFFSTIKRVDKSLVDLDRAQNQIQKIVKEVATDEVKLITLIQDGSMTLKVVNLKKFKQKLNTKNINLPKNLKLEELRLPAKLSAVFGGADVNGVCTFGFVVKDAQGVKGISTAEHCGENVSWTGIKLKHRGRLSSRDTQWFEFPNELQTDAKNHIVSHLSKGTPAIKLLSGTTVLGVGNPVCMFGAEGGRKCGIVVAVNQILAERDPIKRRISHFENLTIVTTNGKQDGGGLSVGGDSGGPYYVFNDAVGQVVAGDKTASYYTPISNVTALGVSVLTK